MIRKASLTGISYIAPPLAKHKEDGTSFTFWNKINNQPRDGLRLQNRILHKQRGRKVEWVITLAIRTSMRTKRCESDQRREKEKSFVCLPLPIAFLSRISWSLGCKYSTQLPFRRPSLLIVGIGRDFLLRKPRVTAKYTEKSLIRAKKRCRNDSETFENGVLRFKKVKSDRSTTVGCLRSDRASLLNGESHNVNNEDHDQLNRYTETPSDETIHRASDSDIAQIRTQEQHPSIQVAFGRCCPINEPTSFISYNRNQLANWDGTNQHWWILLVRKRNDPCCCILEKNIVWILTLSYFALSVEPISIAPWDLVHLEITIATDQWQWASFYHGIGE